MREEKSYYKFLQHILLKSNTTADGVVIIYEKACLHLKD